eukprot:gene11257-12437_t
MESVKVGVCIRPLSREEKAKGCKIAARTVGHQLKLRFGDGREKTFTWDFEPFVYEDQSGQTNDKNTRENINEVVGDFVIKNVFEGFNTSVFSYGAKDSGKTYTMFGENRKNGLIQHILDSIYKKAATYDESTSFRTEISFLEVCGNSLTDLISERSSVKSREGLQKLKIREHPDHGVFVEKLSKHIVTDSKEARSLLEKAIKRRRRLAALDTASRGNSHAIFSIILTQARVEDELPLELNSKVTLIDLASRDPIMNDHSVNGNGDADCTAEEEEKKGGLEVLNDVIVSQASQNYGNFNKSMSKWGNPMVPYRDSVLTWLMKDTLGGNCESMMLCCISPSEHCVQETVNCLKHGSMVRNIINRPIVNEDSNVKLIKELKAEIDALKQQAKLKMQNGPQNEAQKKLQRDTELMQRLTGIWEEKWSKAQKLMEEKALDFTDLGSAVKLETKEPHFVSLGGGRLSVGVSIIPIKKGSTTVGISAEGIKPDLEVCGNGIMSNHCSVEFDGEAVVLYPMDGSVSIDGIPISEPTKLPQGSMICLGKNNYFRFNHPKEAARIKQELPNGRFSIVPDSVYPDVELAIEQRRKEMQEKDKLRAENQRLLALEQQYIQSLERLGFEKEQLEQERRKLQALQQQQQSVANQFDREIAIQIEELELKRQELKRYEHEKEKLLEKEKQIELAGKRLVENRTKQERLKAEFEELQSKQAKIELDEFEKLEEVLMNDKEHAPAGEDAREENGDIVDAVMEGELRRSMEGKIDVEKQRLVLEEFDTLEEDLRLQEMYRQQKVEIDREKQQLEEMERLHKKLELELSNQIEKLQDERERELTKINKEKLRLKKIEERQESMLEQIESEKARLEEEKLIETKKMQKKVEMELVIEEERVNVLTKAAEEQQKERDLINAEKERLLQLEKEHMSALLELQQNKLSQQEKLERERQLELEYIETEQLMLEELEQKQFESARQMEYGAQLLREQLRRESEDEMKKLEENRKQVSELEKKHEEALKETELMRKNLQDLRVVEQEQLKQEKEKLNKMEEEYNEYIRKLEDDKKKLKEELEKQKEDEIKKFKEEFKRTASLPRSFKKLADVDPALFRRSKTPEEKVKEIEEKKQRLDDLRKQAAEKAEIEWKEKKERLERQQNEERELEEKRQKLEEMKREQEMAVKEERQLMLEEAEKIRKHEESLTCILMASRFTMFGSGLRDFKSCTTTVASASDCTHNSQSNELAKLRHSVDFPLRITRSTSHEGIRTVCHVYILLQKEKELEDLQRERQRRLELEHELENERLNEGVLEKSLSDEKEKLKSLEITLNEERLKRIEIERRLEEKERNEENKVKKEKKNHNIETRTSLSTSNLKHRIPSYTPSIRSFPGSSLTEDIHLLHHIIAAGHIIENCPSVKINKYSCRGYLSKMSRSRFHTTWPKRWFIFDRKLRALCYYQDEKKTKAKGVIYFQAIQEVYVDSSMKKSPNQRTTFCVKTPQRNYLLAAPNALAMSIWIDVICTGKEGAVC